MKLQSSFISLVKHKLPSPTLCCCSPTGFRDLAFLTNVQWVSPRCWSGGSTGSLDWDPLTPTRIKGSFWSPHLPPTSLMQVIWLKLIGHSQSAVSRNVNLGLTRVEKLSHQTLYLIHSDTYKLAWAFNPSYPIGCFISHTPTPQKQQEKLLQRKWVWVYLLFVVVSKGTTCAF